MNDNVKTLTEISKKSGITVPRLKTVVKDVEPAMTLGRTVGYNEADINDALYGSIQDVWEYLTSIGYMNTADETVIDEENDNA